MVFTGVRERTRSGILFLDEVAELPTHLQASCTVG